VTFFLQAQWKPPRAGGVTPLSVDSHASESSWTPFWVVSQFECRAASWGSLGWSRKAGDEAGASPGRGKPRPYVQYRVQFQLGQGSESFGESASTS
jgi:hypothetical protein